jgi:hypothetical protein
MDRSRGISVRSRLVKMKDNHKEKLIEASGYVTILGKDPIGRQRIYSKELIIKGVHI